VTSRPLELAETVFRLYQELVCRRTGFLLADAQRARLESRLAAEARSAGSFYQLYGRLRNEPGDSPLFGRLLDAAVNGETYFFRDPASLRAFSEEIAPERLLAGGQDGVLDVWSAGCATGEEAYSLSIVLHERGILPGRRARILGTDLSPAHVRRARAAIFGPQALRATSPERRREHFEAAPGGLFRLKPELARSVLFEARNLLDEPAGGPAFDVIFCRNVLIYLGEEARSRVVEILASRLKPGGYILLGASDALAAASSSLTLVRFSNDVAYRR
jgi:chemotaxis protein methyltransferase CheR